VLVETDNRTPDLAWAYEKDRTVHQIMLKNHAGWMDLGKVIHENPGKEIVVSLPGRSGAYFEEEKEYIADLQKALTIKFQMFFPIGRLKTSILQLKKTIDDLDGILPPENIMVIMNGFYGEKPEKFFRWNESKLKKKFLAAGGKEIFLPELHEKVMDSYNEDLPFEKAVKEVDFIEKMELERWLNKAHELLGEH
jgi:hypothetical protein